MKIQLKSSWLKSQTTACDNVFWQDTCACLVTPDDDDDDDDGYDDDDDDDDDEDIHVQTWAW